MGEFAWRRTGAVPWLVSSKDESHPAVGGITFGAGSLHQPVEQLGVAGLLAAWLATSLTRPVEAADPGARHESVRVAFTLGPTESSLVTAGSPAAVAAALRRVDEVLTDAAAADLDGGLRDRSRTYQSPLQAWSSHLTARWPGHRPHLAALGPLALDALDAATLGGFATERFATAKRVYWTNEPAVSELDPSRHGDFRPAGGSESIEPAGWREQPGCVLQRNAGELFTVALRAAAATQIALSLLAGTLHRRLVDFEPLASAVRISAYQVGGDVVLACGDADVLPGKDAAARAAVVQTLEDFAAGLVAVDEIARVRAGHIGAARSVDLTEAQGMVAMARRHLLGEAFPTPDTVAREFERASDDQVTQALGGLYSQLLLAVPAQHAAEDPPFPMAERVAPREAEGRRFRNRIGENRSVRCSARRVAAVDAITVPARRLAWTNVRNVTRSSVDFDEVVLRLDVADQAATLVDDQFSSVELVWDAYRHATDLRQLVDRHTAGVPVIHQPPDSGWPARLAAGRRRQRRRTMLGYGVPAAALAIVAALTGFVLMTGAKATVRTVDAGTTVSLANGTTLGMVGNPELIEHYNASIANIYAVQMRMCGGTDRKKRNGIREALNYFGPEKFHLFIGEQSMQSWVGIGIAERPGPRADYVDKGECATGWLLFRLPGPKPDQPPTLRYSNISQDRVTWRMPSGPPISPLSKPCPAPTRDRLGYAGPSWAGCPTPPPR